jgi:hypothetical protein
MAINFEYSVAPKGKTARNVESDTIKHKSATHTRRMALSGQRAKRAANVS